MRTLPLPPTPSPSTLRCCRLPSYSPLNLVAASLLLHLLYSSTLVHAQEIDIPIDYKAVAGKKTFKCVHEEYVHHRICTQQTAKITETECKDEYFALIDGTEQTSPTCGGGSKFECKDEFKSKRHIVSRYP